MNNKILLASVASLALAAAAYASDKSHEGGSSKSNEKEREIHWEYKGEGNPKNWGHLKKEFFECSAGKTQSPIDITKPTEANLPDLELKYKNKPLRIINNGHTIQVNYEGGKMTVGDDTYNVLQFHFHAGSENAINGKLYPMEMHFVHKRDDGALGVLGVMIEQGKRNDAMQKIWDHLPSKVGEEEEYDDVMLNASELLPAKQEYYRFMGSLTTPPCSEGVNWHVLKVPIEMSKDQIEAFTSIYDGNARPLQEKNNRLIILDKNSD